MTSPLPGRLQVQPDRGVIGIHGDQVDTFDHQLAHAPRDGILIGNDIESYLYTAQTLVPVTLHFATPPATTTHPSLGQTDIEIPTGNLVISEITLGAHGPYSLPAGPGIYRLTVHADPGQRRAAAQTINDPNNLATLDAITQTRTRHSGTEQYWITLDRIGDPTPDDNDDTL